MTTYGTVVRNRYQDSVRLMRITEALRLHEGVERAGVIAATPANLELLREGDLWFEGVAEAGPNDIAIAVAAPTEAAAEAALAAARSLLDAPASPATRTTYGSLEAALADAPAAAVGFVAVPGAYAAGEARRVLASGRSVVVFSDNVPLEEEIALKEEAHRRGLLVMGPDAGTVLLGGLALGFCNAVLPGRVGIVAASGTGAQAVASLLAAAGEGVTTIVGLGSRDPWDEIGGISLFDALDSLDRDGATEVVVVVAKAIGPRTAGRLLRRLVAMSKPVVTLVPGWPDGWTTSIAGAHPAFTFRDAAAIASRLDSGSAPRRSRGPGGHPLRDGAVIRGLFAGGTLAQETRAALEAVAVATRPGASLRIEVADLGADEQTRGRPHPMIAPSIVAEAILQAARDPATAVIVFDVVLGYGAHPDPGAVLAPAVAAARRVEPGRPPVRCVAVLCGVEDDPQGLDATRAALERAGAEVVAEPTAAVAAVLLDPERAPPGAGRWAPVRPDAVVTIGADWFAESLEAQGATVLHVEWRPPADGDSELNDLLARLA